MKYQLAIFDFDGTLADSFPFFLQVFNQLARKHGFREIDPSLVPAYRHHTPREMMKLVGMPAWKLPLVAKSFTSLMKQNAGRIGLFEGIEDTLLYLVDSGMTLAIVSSNSFDNVTGILGPANSRLIRHFECGMSIFGKSARIRQALKKTGFSAPNSIYIGDQATDLEAARREKVAFGAVTWGYGTIESMRQHSPEEEFECVSALRRIV